MTQPPPTVAVGLGRGNVAAGLIMLGFLTLLVVAGVVGGATLTGATSSVGYFIAVVFAIPLVLLLIGLPRFFAPRAVVFAPGGLYIRQGSRQEGIEWSLIAGLAIGYEYKQPENPKLLVSTDGVKDLAVERMTGATLEALQLSSQRRFALEIYPARPDAVNFAPKLKPYWVQQVPAAPGLPPMAWRFVLPPVVAIADEVGRGAFTVVPQRWVGFVPRPWSGR